MDSEKNTLSVGGFLFYTEKDAQLARAEEQRIAYLEERINYDSPDSIRYIYEKTIEERLFRTPVGLRYLEKLKGYLMTHGIEEEHIREIPLYTTFDGELRGHTSPARERVVPSKRKDHDMEKARFTISVILNVMLAFAIAAMFFISYVSDQPNIVNYERAITDKYASWEQELTQREEAFREKERELKLSE